MEQRSQDINWKYLAISSIIAFLLFLLNSIILIHIKKQAVIYWFNNIRTTSASDDVVLQTQNFIDSYFWVLPAILICFITQTIATIYLAKKTPDKELTNGLALGLVCMVLVYQLNPILSIAGIIFSLATSYKIKNNRLKLLNNP